MVRVGRSLFFGLGVVGFLTAPGSQPRAAPTVPANAQELVVGAVHPSSTAGVASYFRFVNPTNADGAYQVTLVNDRGQVLGVANGIAGAKVSTQLDLRGIEVTSGAAIAAEAGRLLTARVWLHRDAPLHCRELEHFPAKWVPVRRRKCDQFKNLGRNRDSI